MITINEKLLRVWLSRRTSGGAWRAEQLISYFGGIDAVYNATLADYMNAPGMKKAIALALSDKSLSQEEKILSDCKELGINILTPADKGFKYALTEISAPVGVLYTMGTIPDWDNILGIAVIGTRNTSEYGKVAADRLSHELATEGVTIISGMARGIDSIALRSALKTGMSVVAVLGSGLDQAYPPENADLMRDIIANGCVISEYPPFTPPIPRNFPARNRIVSCLADGVLAIEAPLRSGTLITTRLAKEMERPVFAVPGSIFSKNAEGTNSLIKDGATITSSALDVIEAFPEKAEKLVPPEKIEHSEAVAEANSFPELSDKENQILSFLRQKDMHTEELAARCNLPIAKINPMLTMLELDGYIKKSAGNIYRYNSEK